MISPFEASLSRKPSNHQGARSVALVDIPTLFRIFSFCKGPVQSGILICRVSPRRHTRFHFFSPFSTVRDLRSTMVRFSIAAFLALAISGVTLAAPHEVSAAREIRTMVIADYVNCGAY